LELQLMERKVSRYRDSLKATLVGLAVTAGLGGAIIAGSRNLQHFDAALFAYLFASLFAAFGLAYRYTMWLQRPPTAMYWKRGWQVILSGGGWQKKSARLGERVVRGFALNQFIFKRSWLRGLAHWLIMWGCLIAAAITFPLVFGWVHFQSVPGQFNYYRIVVFGFPTITVEVHSLFAHLLFHGLVWASFLVIAGVMLAFLRRMRDHGAEALQRFGEDILPLLMLFAISVTGLLIWVSYEWMEGYAYSFLAIIHAVTVILTLLWLPFGKLFHIFQRPAQLGVAFYKDAGQAGDQAHCVRCGDAYASAMHVEDLISVQRELGYQYDVIDSEGGEVHYQRVCPKCRRTMLALAQGSAWADARVRALDTWDNETVAENNRTSATIDIEGSLYGN
jgi:hypothetical protein